MSVESAVAEEREDRQGVPHAVREPPLLSHRHREVGLDARERVRHPHGVGAGEQRKAVLVFERTQRRDDLGLRDAQPVRELARLPFGATSTIPSSARNLGGRSLEERDQILVLRTLTEHYQDFTMLHGIRTRRAGTPNFAELFLEFPPEKPMGQVQDVIDHLQATIRSLLGAAADVIIMPTRQAPPEAA